MAYEKSIRDGTHPGMRSAAFFHPQGWIDAREDLSRLVRSLPPAWKAQEFFYQDAEPRYKTPLPSEDRVIHALHGGLGARRRRQLDQGIEHFLHAEIVDRRAEEYGRLTAGKESFQIERMRSAVDQLHFHLQLLDLAREHLGQLSQTRTGQSRPSSLAAAAHAGEPDTGGDRSGAGARPHSRSGEASA